MLENKLKKEKVKGKTNKVAFFCRFQPHTKSVNGYIDFHRNSSFPPVDITKRLELGWNETIHRSMQPFVFFVYFFRPAKKNLNNPDKDLSIKINTGNVSFFFRRLIKSVSSLTFLLLLRRVIIIGYNYRRLKLTFG